MTDLFYRLLAGFLIGVGCILPGVSGGVMAVSLGLYQPALDALTSFFRNIRKHTAFLLPLAIGGLAGLLMGAEGLAFAINRWETPILFLFLGFILGGVPAIFRDALKDGFALRYLWALVPGALLLMGMLCLGDRPQAAMLTPLQWLVAGGIYAIGTVIPGLSASFLLIQLGWYQQVLLVFSRLLLPDLLWFATGFVAVTLACLHGVKQLFDRYPAYASFGVIGLLAASVIPAIPAFLHGPGMLVDLSMLGLGLLISLAMERLGKQVRTTA